jgi:catechol 2,3-dioxygenase-like lactoylglutathione lyase family enzyme
LNEQKGNFSKEGKDTFDPRKRYVGIRLQQGVPLLDRDWNELEDIRRYEGLMLRKWYIGNGTPDDGFKISAYGRPSKYFRIAAGRCIVDGFEAVNDPENEGDYLFTLDARFEKDLNKEGIVSEELKGVFEDKRYPLSYNARIRKRKENEWVVTDKKKFIVKKEEELKVYEVAKYILGEALNPPSEGVREDTVYLDIGIEVVTSEDDPVLKNPDVNNIETCVRHKLAWQVRVSEGSAVYPKDLPFHHYYNIAKITREAGRDTILDTDIEDLRTTWLAMDLIQNRFKGVINTILKGNLPSDPEVQLVVHEGVFGIEGYRLSFEDTKGNIWLFWCADMSIWCKTYRAGRWKADTQLTSAGTCIGYSSAFEDADGNIWLFWLADGNIWCKTYRADRWSAEKQLTTGETFKGYINAFGDADGNIWLFWLADGNIWCKTYRAGSWGTEKQLTPAGAYAGFNNTFEDADGNIWLFWLADGNIWCKTYRAGSWGTETQLSKGGYHNAFEDADGNIWLFWYADNNIWCKSTNRAGSWGVEKQLTTGETSKHYSNAFGDAQGKIWLFWREDRNIWCMSTNRAGTWGDDTQLTTGAEGYFKSFEDHEGSIWLLFRKPDYGNIWCKRYVDGDWLAEMRLCNGTTAKNCRDSFEDHEGNIWLFWEEWPFLDWEEWPFLEPLPRRAFSMWCKKCYASL